VLEVYVWMAQLDILSSFQWKSVVCGVEDCFELFFFFFFLKFGNWFKSCEPVLCEAA